MKYETLQDMPDQEAEDMIEAAHGDLDLCSAFIDSERDDFDEYCRDHGIHHDYEMDHEFDFIESRDDTFFEFAFQWYKEKGKL